MLPLATTNSKSRSIHATCVVINGNGVLITGKPGTGKSSIALNLLRRGHQLISDDLTTLEISGDKLIATCPTTIKNLLYTRQHGFIEIDKVFGKKALSEKATINLVVHLTPLNQETSC